MDDDDDLFAGLDDGPPRSKPNKTTSSGASKSDFMSSLFGNDTKPKNTSQSLAPSSNLSKTRDFVLDDKYKTSGTAAAASSSAVSEDTSAKPPMGPQRSRRGGGSPFMSSTTVQNNGRLKQLLRRILFRYYDSNQFCSLNKRFSFRLVNQNKSIKLKII